MVAVDETQRAHMDEERRRIPPFFEPTHHHLDFPLELGGWHGPVEIFVRPRYGIHVFQAHFGEDVHVVFARAKRVSDTKIPAFTSKEGLRPGGQLTCRVRFASGC
jgi:hypothetical protein